MKRVDDSSLIHLVDRTSGVEKHDEHCFYVRPHSSDFGDYLSAIRRFVCTCNNVV